MFKDFKIKKLELEVGELQDTVEWKNSMLTLFAEEIDRLNKVNAELEERLKNRNDTSKVDVSK